MTTNADLVASAARVWKTSFPEDYIPSGQQYRDFKAVFMDGEAQPAQGQRVLATIFRWGGIWDTPHSMREDGSTDVHGTLVRAGAMEVCQRILATLTKEPVAPKDEVETYGD